ncbi:MAG: hypothetical protein ABSD39_10365 [Terriglobales bacterium]
MTERGFLSGASTHTYDSPAVSDEVLERAVAKLVAAGARVGIGTDAMIKLLESGMSVQELVEYVLTRAGDVG